MKRHHLIVSAVTTLGAAAVILSISIPNQDRLILSVWTIGIPAWSWFEYTFLISASEKNDPIAFERLKYSQELGSKVWLAVAGLLALFYLNESCH